MIEIRKMEPHEAKAVKKIAMRAFSGTERLFVSKPQEALVALYNGEIVGGIMVKYIVHKNVKIGYYDGAFIAPEHRGKGIATKLYKETADYLWAQGCTALSATVKDDNAASWTPLLGSGFLRVSLTEGVRKLGVLSMILQYFATLMFMSNGMDFYLCVKDGDLKPKSTASVPQIATYLLINTLLFLLAAAWLGRTSFLSYTAAFFTMIFGCALSGYIGTLFSKCKWQFRLTNCGAVITVFINAIGGLYPLIGNWYPKKYENTDAQRQEMGLVALCDWVFILAATVCAQLFGGASVFLRQLCMLGEVFLIYKIIALYPFESYGGRRVFLWDKSVYVIFAIASLAVIFI